MKAQDKKVIRLIGLTPSDTYLMFRKALQKYDADYWSIRREIGFLAELSSSRSACRRETIEMGVKWR